MENYDIVTGILSMHRAPSFEILRDDICNEAPLSENIIRQNLMRAQPDYLDAFNYKMNSPTCYYKNMFVTRRHVFDAYCKWLFSFMIDSVREILSKTSLLKRKAYEQRLPAHFSERMMNVWLMKNHLRIKEIDIVQLEGL